MNNYFNFKTSKFGKMSEFIKKDDRQREERVQVVQQASEGRVSPVLSSAGDSQG